jgi:hypothetical protein
MGRSGKRSNDSGDFGMITASDFFSHDAFGGLLELVELS